MQFMDESHYDQLMDEDVSIYKPNGEPLLVLLKQAIDAKQAANAWTALKKVGGKTNNRSTATGIETRHREKLDGTVSGTTQVPNNWAVVSALLGSYERTPRTPYARNCAWNAKNAELFQRTIPMLVQSSELFREWVQQRYEIQMGYINRTDKAWVIPGTAYSTVTVNKNFRTAAHKDAGDLEAGFSNMIVIRQGSMSGGHLVLPNWRIAVKLDNLDLVMFDAHEFHGNTAIAKMSSEAVRCSLVCYYRENMYKCGSPEYELKQAKNRKPGQPIYWEEKRDANIHSEQGPSES